MTRTPAQSPPLRRSPRHDKRKHRSESDVRKDVRRKSAGRTATKKQRKTKTPAAGEKLPVFESSDGDDDDDDDVASSKSSGRDSSKEEDESSASSRRSPPATIKNKKKTKPAPKTSNVSKQQQKKKPRQKTSAAVEGGRMPNYSEDEDYLIAVAYTHVTVDPIRGVGQKGENFWMRVHEKFCMLQQKELVESGQDIQLRTKDSIEQRWKKKISKSVQLWNKNYKQLKGLNKSGWNEEKYIEEASKLYKLETGEIFRFDKCVPVLHKLPKFDPMVATGTTLTTPPHDADFSSESSEVEKEVHEGFAIVSRAARSSKKKVNNNVPPQGSSMERPLGMKKAKLMKKLEDTGTLSSIVGASSLSPFDSITNNSSILADMSNATKDLVVAFKANASLKRDELRMRKHDKWMKMATMYISCGKQDMALKMMQKIQDDDDNVSATPPAATSRSNDSQRTPIGAAAGSTAFMLEISEEEQSRAIGEDGGLTIPNEVQVVAATTEHQHAEDMVENNDTAAVDKNNEDPPAPTEI